MKFTAWDILLENCMKTPKNKRKWYIVGMIGIIVVSVCMLCQENTGGRAESLTGLALPEAIERQCRELQQKRIAFLEEAQEEEAKTELDEISEVMEANLVEQISNPRMQMYPWSTPGLVERPFRSLAQDEQIETQEFEYIPKAGLDPVEAAKWGGDILYRLVLEPEAVREYGAILTKSSIEAWENFQWTYVYIPPEYFQVRNLDRIYELDHTFAEGVDRDLINFIHGDPPISDNYVIDSKFINIALEFRWDYEVDTGLIQIQKMEYSWL